MKVSNYQTIKNSKTVLCSWYKRVYCKCLPVMCFTCVRPKQICVRSEKVLF